MNLYSLLRVPLLILGLVVALVISLSNRGPVHFSLDPFSADAPVVAFELPLYMLLFGFLLLGVLIGGMTAWVGQMGWRKRARKGARDVKHLEKDLVRAKTETDEASSKEESKAVTTT